MLPDLHWTSGAFAFQREGCELADIVALCRQYGPPIGYHAIVRDGVVLGYAPNDDECLYPIGHIIPAEDHPCP